ncbi:ABC transporter permease subunit [Nocardioides cheoyonin]|uniref:ABC transporter permease subunit n=1 Tax=Nocardioides cheoyonin TaxID=3156615 RepID=UPI0032B59D10
MSTTATGSLAPSRRFRLPGRKRWIALAIVVLWVVGWAILKNHHTLTLGGAETTGFHRWLNDLRDDIEAARTDNWFFHGILGTITDRIDSAVTWVQELLSEAPADRPTPQIGWLGVVALAVWIAYAVAGWASGLLVLVAMLLFGFLGYWSESIDTLIVTGLSVLVSIVIGLPLGVWMAGSKRVSAVFTPVLDLAQTLPAFAYLAPLALFFGIGPAAAIITTVIYALPTLVRIAAHGIATVDPSSLEASESLGSTRWQRLRKVQLPMARRTIVVGINQCTMAALAMATIVTLINAPGLGAPVLQALQSLDIGTAFVSGLAIVIMAIMLDRTTTAASERAELAARGRVSSRAVVVRRLVLGLGAVAVVVALYLSHSYLDFARFPSSPDLGSPLSDAVTSATNWVVDTFDTITEWFKNRITDILINPLQDVLAESPWWLSAVAFAALSWVLGGWRPLAVTVVCEAVILGTGLWHDSMVTLTTTLVATLLVVIAAVVVGVWMGRNRLVDRILRPILDALQTIPPFVYLVPALALFGPTRFTAVVAALAYGVPIATKLVADGIRGVTAVSVEAAESLGVTKWQMIRKVQLPIARGAVVLAANQGLLYVLSMVVVGGLVGGGGLGYLVVSGFSQGELFGKGLAAGIAITAIGVMLDRTAKHTAARFGRG